MRPKLSQYDENAKELEALREELDSKALLHKPIVQGLIRKAYKTSSQLIYNSVTRRLRLILDAYNTNARRQPDPFRPYGPAQLLSQGDLHLLDQMDEVPFMIDADKLVTGAIVIGPQGSGKSRFITHLCAGIIKAKPNVRITLIDPKFGFKNLPSFRHVDLSKASFDLKSPSNTNQQNFIFQFIPVLTGVCSLIYGQDFVEQAADIALSQLQQRTKQTGEEMTLCLKDILEALKTIKTSNFRLVGYLDASKTALSLAIGKQGLFSSRGALSFEWIFSENTVLDSRCLTSQLQCKVMLISMLFWLYQQAKNLPESKELKHVIIIDDSTRFAGVANQFDAQKRTSQLGHILAVLRSAGISVIFVTQLPAQIDPAVLYLSRSMFIVGNVNGEENLRIIQNCMSLSPEQKNAILRFKPREILAFVSGSLWPYPTHGWVPFVGDLPQQDITTEDISSLIKPWHSLTEIPQKETEQTRAPETPSAPKPVDNEQPNINNTIDKLIWDCISYPHDKVTGHIKRLGISVRVYETAMNAAIQDGFLSHSMSGKSVYLIPTPKAYEKFSLPCPYERNASIEHSFYVQLASHTLKKNQKLSKVQPETPIGSKGATIDVTTIDKSGKMTAYEITLSTSNLLSNAAKLQDTSYERIVWLCKDAATANAVKSYFNKSTALPENLTIKFEYLHFSKFSSNIERKK